MKFKVSKSPYGPKDEIGRLNEITPKSRAQVLERIDPSEVYDLSVDYFVGMPAWDFVGDPPYQIWMTHTPQGTILDNPLKVSEAVNRYVSYSGDAISMYKRDGRLSMGVGNAFATFWAAVMNTRVVDHPRA